MIRNFQTYLVRFTATFAVLLGLTLTVFQSVPASAAPVDVLQKCNSQSKVCQGTGTNALYGLVEKIINLLLMVIGIIAVIMIIIGGIRYTTSGGDAGQTKMAKDTILYAIVGLVVAIMSYALVNWVIGNI